MIIIEKMIEWLFFYSNIGNNLNVAFLKSVDLLIKFLVSLLCHSHTVSSRKALSTIVGLTEHFTGERKLLHI